MTARLVANVPASFKTAVLDHIAKSGGRWSSMSHFIKESMATQMQTDVTYRANINDALKEPERPAADKPEGGFNFEGH